MYEREFYVWKIKPHNNVKLYKLDIGIRSMQCLTFVRFQWADGIELPSSSISGLVSRTKFGSFSSTALIVKQHNHSWTFWPKTIIWCLNYHINQLSLTTNPPSNESQQHQKSPRTPVAIKTARPNFQHMTRVISDGQSKHTAATKMLMPHRNVQTKRTLFSIAHISTRPHTFNLMSAMRLDTWLMVRKQ